MKGDVPGGEKPPHKKQGLADLRGFSDIIREQGERRQREQDEKLEKMRELLSAQKEKLLSLTNEDLLTYFLEANNKGYGDPRELVLWQELVEVARIELLRRMEN